MEIERALTIRDRAKARLVDLYSSAEHFGWPHSTILERKRAIYEQCAKAPRWVRAYLDGYWACMMAQAYRHDLVYGAYIGGTFYSTHRDRADYYGKHGIEARAFRESKTSAGHYWKRDIKPFYLG